MKITKIFSFFVIFIFIFQLSSFALAEEIKLDARMEANTASSETSVKSNTTLEVVTIRDRGEDQKEIENESEKEDNYTNAKERYIDSKESYLQAKEDFIEARNMYEREKNALSLKSVIDKVKNYLLRSDEAMISYLTALKIKINENDDIPSERKAEIIVQIDSDILWLTSKQSEISGATTREQLISISRQLKDKWQEIKPRERLYVGAIISYRLDNILNGAEKTSERISLIIQKLKGEGKDTIELEALLLDYDLKIESAQVAKAKAIESFRVNGEVTERETRILDGRKNMQQAQSDLKSAHEDLRKMIKIINEYRVEINTEANGDLNE